jgi:hypothetical protein
MKRITQSLFEEIEKITLDQIQEKKHLKHDEDKDGDEDAADYMMKRRKAGGQSHAQAHAATRKHNEETEQEGEELDEELTSDQIEKHNQLTAKHRALAKNSGGDTRVAHQRAANLHAGAVKNPWYKKGSSDALSASKKLGVTMEEVEHVEEAWPGTPEHKAKHGSDYEKHMMKYGGNPKAARATKGRYGYEGASGSETPETAADSSKIGRGRKKMKEETIIKHEDFTLEIINNPTFKDFLDAAKPYVQTEELAIAVAESFFQEEDTSLVIESQAREMFESVLDSHRKEGVEVTDMEISLKDDNIAVCYTVTESETVRHYIHQGKIIKGEE